MSTITLPGLSTGIDTSAIIQQLVAAASVPANRLKAQQSRYQNKADAFAAFRTKVEALQTAADALRSAAGLRAFGVTSSDEKILTADASSAASEGSHTLVVNQLAAAAREVHEGLATADTKVGAGAFAYVYNGVTETVRTTADTTLADLRDLINNDGGNPGVTASLLEYDAGGGHVFHLVLGGNNTGSAYAVTIDDAGTTLDTFDTDKWTITQNAQDSQVQVDGYPSGSWISRSTNTIDDVLPGVTVHLQATGTAKVGLTRDTAGLKAKLNALVTAYNDVVSYAKSKTAYDAQTKTGGILMGEYSVTASLYQLQLPFIQTANGFLSGSDPYTLAAQLGLSTDEKGNLQLVESSSTGEKNLDDAIGDNYLGVLSLLGAQQTGASDTSDLKFYGATTSTAPAAYDVRVTFKNGLPDTAQIKLTTEPDSAYRAAAIDGNTVIGAAGYPEQGLQISASHSGDGTVNAVVRVRQGLAGALYDGAQNLLDHTIQGAQDGAQTSIDNLQHRIDEQERRLQRLQDQLTAQYAQLEAALTLLSQQRSALTMFSSTSTGTSQ